MLETTAQAALKFGLLYSSLNLMGDRALDAAGQKFIQHIREAIGTYEYGWEPLKEATIARKGGLDTPLLETTQLRESYTYQVINHLLLVGSNDPRAPMFEYGTSRMPPRPVIEPTISHHGHEIFERNMGLFFQEVMIGVLTGRGLETAISSALMKISALGVVTSSGLSGLAALSKIGRKK
jgi:phage gpG-like protein